jgi:hypothetical protein
MAPAVRLARVRIDAAMQSAPEGSGGKALNEAAIPSARIFRGLEGSGRRASPDVPAAGPQSPWKRVAMITPQDSAELRAAKTALENPGVAAKLTNLVGVPVGRGFELLPAHWRRRLGAASHEALMIALKTALRTMSAQRNEAHPRWHKVAATLSGGLGGAFGLPALIVELPLSTTIMLRSIADIARSLGEDLAAPESQLACLEVFALGGPSPGDDGADFGYFAVRGGIARAVSEASRYLAQKTAIDESAPAIVRLVAIIAARFQVHVSQKAVAMAVPLIGAAGGATVNLLFVDHFQDISRAHFAVRRLERHYGAETVRAAYEAL